MWSVIGQDGAVSFLRHSLSRDRMANGYLFTGPPHIGKMTLALELAKALNCLDEDPPCDHCQQCRRIAAANHADVQIIRLENSVISGESREKALISVEQIRQLQHTASLAPYEGRCRVFIIEEAEKLSTSAANCLLKTLEEPPPDVVFVLLAQDAGLLPQTVVSRCQHLRLKAIPRCEIVKALKERGIEPEKVELLARLSHGHIGWALEVSKDERLLGERQERLQRLLGIMAGDLEQRFDYASSLAANFAEKRPLVWEELEAWLDIWRDLLLCALGSGEDIINLDIKDWLADMAATFTLGEIRGFTEYSCRVRKQLELNANPRLVLEVMMLDMPRIELQEVPSCA